MEVRFGDGRLPARFWAKVSPEPNSGCWLWTASIKNTGYGQFGLDDGMRYSHRVAYQFLVGPIPSGLELDHLCRTRVCCNPLHLEAVTHLVNYQRGTALEVLKRRQGQFRACKNGHPADGNRSGTACLVCLALRNKSRRRRRCEQGETTRRTIWASWLNEWVLHGVNARKLTSKEIYQARPPRPPGSRLRAARSMTGGAA